MDALLSFNIGGKNHYSFYEDDDNENYSDKELNSADSLFDSDLDSGPESDFQITEIDELFDSEFSGGCNCQQVVVTPEEVNNNFVGGDTLNDLASELITLGSDIYKSKKTDIDEKVVFELSQAMNNLRNQL